MNKNATFGSFAPVQSTEPLRVGDWVEVLSKEEILHTLDKNGRLEDLPFMPQMFRYCGQRFQVYKRAHKTCDTVSGHYVGLRLSRAVHLDLRCDGQAYDGCQAACLLFWKEAWLKASDAKPPSVRGPVARATDSGCTETDVWRATKHGLPDHPVFSCQATELLHFTTPLKWWDARQYIETFSSGNASLHEMLRGLVYLLYYYATLSKWRRVGRPGRWLYDRFQAFWGGVPFPQHEGQIPEGAPTPRCDLNLNPGDLVRVKPYEEILATLDAAKSNRGLNFDGELVPYCGKTYRVKVRVEKFVDEKTGRMRHLRTPAVILEGAYCKARYCGQRIFCPRSIYVWWREIWLERVAEAHTPSPQQKLRLTTFALKPRNRPNLKAA
jgi:hypothetical protein